jgi:uncharacterized membrane protein YfcA|tara:strand:- start:795 stop:1571 length:777 start_codon:yes stop_codon:yes gene_type:complete
MAVIVLAIPSALVIGFTLGLFGSGGSILSLPVLVYLLGYDEKVAIASSLAVVGLISLFGSITYVRQRTVDWWMVLVFGFPAVIGTYLGAAASVLVSGTVQLITFSLVMMVAAVFMIVPTRLQNKVVGKTPGRSVMIVAEGLGVGGLTGFVGVGGGFLIVPALVLLGGINMHRAIATSLVIITLKSCAGFIKYVDVLSGTNIDLWVIGLFSIVGIAGCVLGGYVAPHIHQERLKRSFGIMLVISGAFIFFQSLPALAGI